MATSGGNGDPGRKGVWFCSTLSTHHPEHAHAGMEFNLLMCGSLRYRLGRATVEVQAGQLVAIAPTEPHQLISASEDAAFWVVEFERESARLWPHEKGVHWTDPRWMGQLVAVLRKLWLRPAGDSERSLYSSLQRCIADAPPPGHPRTVVAHPAVSRARALCEGSMDPDSTAAGLAKAAGISASRLAHLFQEQLGLSPLQYRNFCRVQHFIQQYDEAQPNLMRAALRSGFGSYPQFHRAFQQVCGASPSVHLDLLARDAWMEPRRTLPPAEVPSVVASIAP